MPASPNTIPRGIEVLVKKASVDPTFRTLLLERRAGAAREIALKLDPAEAAMLNAIPAAQLEAIITRTTVDPMSRAAFLGKAAALMLAALGAGIGCDEIMPTRGVAPDRPSDKAPSKPKTEATTAEAPADPGKEIKEPPLPSPDELKVGNTTPELDVPLPEPPTPNPDGVIDTIDTPEKPAIVTLGMRPDSPQGGRPWQKK